METHSSVLAWEIPWIEELGELQSMGSQRFGQDLVTNTLIFNSQLFVCMTKHTEHTPLIFKKFN